MRQRVPVLLWVAGWNGVIGNALPLQNSIVLARGEPGSKVRASILQRTKFSGKQTLSQFSSRRLIVGRLRTGSCWAWELA